MPVVAASTRMPASRSSMATFRRPGGAAPLRAALSFLAGEGGVLGGVVLDVPPGRGVAQCSVQHAVDVLDGLGRQDRRLGHGNPAAAVAQHGGACGVDRHVLGDLVRFRFDSGDAACRPVPVHGRVGVGLAAAGVQEVAVEGVEGGYVDVLGAALADGG